MIRARRSTLPPTGGLRRHPVRRLAAVPLLVLVCSAAALVPVARVAAVPAAAPAAPAVPPAAVLPLTGGVVVVVDTVPEPVPEIDGDPVRLLSTSGSGTVGAAEREVSPTVTGPSPEWLDGPGGFPALLVGLGLIVVAAAVGLSGGVAGRLAGRSA